MRTGVFALISIVGLSVGSGTRAADPLRAQATIFEEPSPGGRIDPKLFGNFIELLDDVVPGMWAELLNDRSFEGVIPSANWCYYDGSLDICDRAWDTNATWTLDTNQPFNGKQSARLDPGNAPASLTQSGLAFKRGIAYGFAGYLRSTGNIKATVSLKCQLPTGDWMTLASKDLPVTPGTWQKYSAQLLSKGSTDRAVFELRVRGRGHLWADKLSLIPGDNLRGWRRDVVETVTEIHPAIIRWGGSSVDPGRYQWKAGIGDRDLRVPWRNQNWGRIDPNDVGVDEFCQFCELTKSEPLVCVSFGDGAQSAGDLVQYCNGAISSEWGAKRAANGHPAAYRVKFWQIGNEIGGDDPAYLAQVPGFIRSMRQADPDVQIMSSFPHQKLLEAVGKDLAFVCPHHYTPDLEACERDLSSVTRLIDSTPGCAHLKIGITEWNIDAGSWGLGRAKQATLGAALMNARYLHVLMRHSDKVKIACRSNLANSYCGAIIETGASGSGVLLRPSGLVMKLYAQHAKPIPLRLDTRGTATDLFGCGSMDGRSGVLFAVNSRTESVDLSIGFAGFHAAINGVESVCDSINAGQPDIMNHWETPKRVRMMPIAFSGSQMTLPALSATAIEWVRKTE